MGESKTTDILGGAAAGSPSFDAACAVIDQLSDGAEITPEGREAAKGEMLAGIRNGSGAEHGRASEGMLAIFASAEAPTERAQMVGELIAAGTGAGGVLEAITTDHLPLIHEFLSPEEIATLPELLELPVEQRLTWLAEWLGDEANRSGGGVERPDKPKEPDPGSSSRLAANALPPRRWHEELQDEEGDPVPSPPPASPQDILADPAVPEEIRAEAALALGSDAVPLLAAAAKNPGDHEFVFSSLVRLSRLPDSQQAVREEMVRMSFDRNSHPGQMGEAVRAALGDAPAVEPPAAARITEGDGGWLSRALADCSAPNILCASAGREAAVIPLLLTRKLELRSGATRRHQSF